MALGVDGVRIGCWTDTTHHTGCTVVLPPEGSQGAIAVRGGGPGTREAAALGPNGSVRECHAVVLSGGSAFGLATADGVVDWCVEQGIGYDVGIARVPIVGAAIVFDLRGGDAPRPGPAAGRAACEAASDDEPPQGSVGVGTGCTVGKIGGIEFGSKGGQGCAVLSAGGVTVGALVAVNALGDVIDERGEVLAGSRAPDDVLRYPAAPGPREQFEERRGELAQNGQRSADDGGGSAVDGGGVTQNTVIGCLVTDARLSKPDAVRVADLSHSGVARAVSPAHTSHDGDAVFCCSTQQVDTRVDLVADLGARAVAAAIRSAVRHAEPMPGYPVDPRATI